VRAPPPIIGRATSNSTSGRRCWVKVKLSVSIKSGAVSISVPSRSKTMVSMVWRSGRWPVAQARAGKTVYSLSHGFCPTQPPMDTEVYKRAAAVRALEFVRSGMRLGLGTGSTAKHFVDLLGERVRAGLDIEAVPTSEATRAQAARVGIALTSLDNVTELDLTVDGADEIAPDLTLIKGGGGALLREKIVAAASARMIVIADATKWVAALGRFPLPIEIAPFGTAAITRAVEAATAEAGCPGPAVLRNAAGGQPFITDGGHWLLDAKLQRIADPVVLAARLSAVPGVMEHGLFIGMAQTAIVAGPDGVRIIERP
jgi:ribose 5-phosphate isomerase A